MRFLITIFSLQCLILVCGSRDISAADLKVEAWKSVLAEKIYDSSTKKGLGTFQLLEEEEGVLRLKMSNKEFFTEAGFQNFLIEFSLALAEKKPPFFQMKVEALGERKTILLSTITIRDVLAYQKSQISRAEFLRRLDIQQDETLDSLKSKALESKKAGHNKEAMNYLERWLTKESTILPLSLLGNIYRDEGRYFDAISIYEKILPLDQSSLFAHHNLAFCHEKLGAYDRAIQSYTEAIKLDPQNHLLHQQLADIYRKDGRFEDALATLAVARGLLASADLWLIEGNIHRDAKRIKQAKVAYEKGKMQNPQDGRFYFNLLLLSLDAKQFTEARKQFSEMQKKFPDLATELESVMGEL